MKYPGYAGGRISGANPSPIRDHHPSDGREKCMPREILRSGGAVRARWALVLCISGWIGGAVQHARADLFVANERPGVIKRFNGTTGAFVSNFTSGGDLNSPYG